MRDRLEKNTVGGKQVMCKTFHAFGLHIIRNFGPSIGLPMHPTIYDDNDRRDIIASICKESGYRVSKKDLEVAYDSRFRDVGSLIESQVARSVVMEYTNRMKEQGALDFDMIIMEAVNVLALHIPAAQHYHDLFDYILVDEAQDADKLQHELITCINPKNVFYVADVDQCIYEWRSAKPERMLEILGNENFEVHRLTETHRCTQEIADIANNVISNNVKRFEKDMVATKAGKPVRFLTFSSRYREAEFVWDYVDTLTEVGTCEPEEIFVLARTNRVVRYLEKVYHEKSLRSFNIETTADKADMWNSMAVRSMVSTIKLIVNRRNEYLARSSVFGVKNRHNIDCINYSAINSGHTLSYEMAKSDPWMKDFLAKNGDTTCVFEAANRLTNYFRPVLSDVGLSAQKEFVHDFVNFLYDWKEERDSCSVGDFIDWFVSRSVQDVVDFEEKTVKLMTVHAAKGLEAPYVIIAGLEDDLFPSRRSDIEEERRLFYVAATRAKERLTLLFAIDQPSQFIEEAHG